ncbi:hypothetical protein [Bacillus sp. MUM 116]|uniref:hypothetical protein n=1 Tax=Bacillus sp. MUM 116 TaxID=1678002 RepID=UPI000A4CD5F5
MDKIKYFRGVKMSILVYQTFVIKQDKFKEAIENLQEIKKFRNENYDHKVKILTPISGEDYTYSLLSTYEGLAEMELQNKKMFEDEEYIKFIEEFFLENIAQGSMYTQIYRTMSEKKSNKKDEK